MRSALALIVTALAAALAAAPAGSSTHGRQLLRPAGLLAPSRPFHDAVLARKPSTARGLYDSGGVYTTKDGISVRVVVSASYALDAAANQAIVDFLGFLLHGPELGKLTVYVGTFEETQRVCGVEALACYIPSLSALYMPGEVPEDVGVPIEQILAHEYGHHVAANRSNAPWDAGTWGPKRWADYEGVCQHALHAEMFPGDESAHYTLNPGEGWAESFRLANAQRAGSWLDIGWPIVDDIFRPDTTALGLVATDVLQPWTAATTYRIRGMLKRRQLRKFRIATPLDGSVTAAVQAKRGALTAFFDAGGRQISPGGRRSTATVCGQSSLWIGVQAVRAGAFAITYSTP
jgi:hypothetical protein